jgi:hypothetical protein
MIARRADTKARADFATWKMMAKLNGVSSLPNEAMAFLSSYKAFLETMSESEASEATISLMYKNYYADMGGAGMAPDIKSVPGERVVEIDNITAFKRPTPPQPKAANSRTDAKPRLPVALIFGCLIVVYVSIRYLLR